jgi:hypothetical protein
MVQEASKNQSDRPTYSWIMKCWRAFAILVGLLFLTIGVLGIAEYFVTQEYRFAGANWGWLGFRLVIFGVGIWFVARGSKGLRFGRYSG